MYIEPSETSDASKLNFEYYTKDFVEQSLGIQLKFENPDYVSQVPRDRDYLIIEQQFF